MWRNMKKLKLYLDTTIWNFVFVEDAPQYQSATTEFFKLVQAGKYVCHVSKVVMDEVEAAPLRRRRELIGLLKSVSPVFLENNVEVNHLGELYISRKVLPSKSRADAQHLAFATFYEMDALVSWNFKHLANISKKEKVTAVNMMEGYFRPLDLITPLEVSEDEGI
jgi:predicted nucleic acid-binding protein